MAPTATAPSPANPNLAGQGAEYISRQLQHFKAGIRVNPVMQGMVATLTPEDMTALGVYFSQQKPKNLAAKDATLVDDGADALSRRRRGDRIARVRGLPFAERRRHPEELSRDCPASTPTTRMRS